MKSPSLRYYFFPSLSLIFITSVIALGLNVYQIQQRLEREVEAISLLSGLRNDLNKFLSQTSHIDQINSGYYLERFGSPEIRKVLSETTVENISEFILVLEYSTPRLEISRYINELNGLINEQRVTTASISEQLRTRWVAISVLGLTACIFALLSSILFIRFRLQTDKLDEKNKELEKARIDAEAASLSKSEFVNVMSHEIRTPLNAVIGLTHILSQSNPTAEQKKNIELLQFSSENLLSLINDILDFGKIDAGKVVLEERPFHLVKYTRKIMSTLEPFAKSKNLRLFLEIHGDVEQQVIGDPTRLSQIMNNLVNNAIKFTPRGFVKISIEEVATSKIDKTFKISIRDSGIGIAPSQKKTIFEGFSQANSQTTRKFGGSGLGLTISQRLLELMDSKLFMESELNRGSTFWFQLSLPLAPDLDLKPDDKIPQPIVFPGELKILVVEDNRINMMIMEKLLADMKLSCLTATNGQEAVDKVQEEDFDLILMDLQMPVKDGFTASMEIAEMKGDDKPVILAISAANEPREQNSLEKSGIDGYIRKPIDIDQFKSKVNSFIR